MKTSLFEIFKIGIGPSSSHTVGPMRAANDFVAALGRKSVLIRVRRVLVELYGSLALTGRGHGTDHAILLGLCGELPDRIDPDVIDGRLAALRAARALVLRGVYTVPFDESRDFFFHKDQTLPGHSNAMRFSAFDQSRNSLAQEVYYSIGGGFIVREGDQLFTGPIKPVPYPFGSADELLRMADKHGMALWQIALENEKAWTIEGEIRPYITQIWNAMQACVRRGLETEGILPGGLNVKRRAPNLAKKLGASGSSISPTPTDSEVERFRHCGERGERRWQPRGDRSHERRGWRHSGRRSLLQAIRKRRKR